MQDNLDSDNSLHDQITNSDESAIKRYQKLALGSYSWWYLIKYEIITLVSSWVPGALGLFLRKFLYPYILGSVGNNVVFGQSVSIVHGEKISIDDNVVIGDYAVLDAKGDSNSGIVIGSNTIISRNAIVSCKNGNVSFGADCSVGINTLVHAVAGSDVEIGDDVVIGAFCYFIGGGTYKSDDISIPFKKQGSLVRGGIKVANNVWFGSNVQILDGATIGTGCIVGASSVVNRSVDDYWVVAGVPIKNIKLREGIENKKP